MPKRKTTAAESAAYTDDVRDEKGNPFKYSALEKKFVANYLNDPKHSATAAVKAAGYECSTDGSARALASKIMAKPHIRAAINQAFESLTMPKFEVLFRLARIAGGSIVDVLNEDNELDLDLARERATDFLIKKIERRRDIVEVSAAAIDGPEDGEGGGEVIERSIIKETVKFEIHDPLKALELLGKHSKLFVERIEATGKDGRPLIPDEARPKVVFYLPDNGRGDADAEPVTADNADGGVKVRNAAKRPVSARKPQTRKTSTKKKTK